MFQERPSRVPGAVLWQTTHESEAAPQVPEIPQPRRTERLRQAEPSLQAERILLSGQAERTGQAPGAQLRVLPDGCMDLIWVDGQVLVAGPDTRAHLFPARAGASYIGLRFAPGTAPAILGVPAHELRDRRVPLADLWPSASARRLAERAAVADDPGEVLQEAAMRRLRSLDGPAGPDRVTAGVVDGLRSGLPVSGIADAAGVSERQLRRRCLGAFGYGPRTLGRILRMNRAVELARTGTPFAVVAVDAGYADQAHLSREVKALAGVPLGALIR
ncbi:helix-turn-helix domain-containing protein [Microbispora sp. NPDC049125]|uniref:helix-turn-helix domain-containing protein n=1 Tax=Microbispora sp. NPDC049125 TaxID=3154929 RepID=UPI0034666FA8